MSTYPISWYPDVHRIFAGCPQKSAGLTAVGHLASFRWNGTGFGNVTGYGNGAPRPVNHKKRTIRFGETKIKLVWKYILKNSFHEIHSWSQRRGQPRSRWVDRPCWLSSSRSQGALHMKSISLAVFCFQKSNASQNWYFRLKLFIFGHIEVQYLKLLRHGQIFSVFWIFWYKPMDKFWKQKNRNFSAFLIFSFLCKKLNTFGTYLFLLWWTCPRRRWRTGCSPTGWWNTPCTGSG